MKASVCSAAPCPAEPSIVVDAPAEVQGAPTLERLDLGRGRSVVHVSWGGDVSSYHLFLAAPLATQGAAPAPLVVHQGWSNRKEGVEGERRSASVEILGAKTGPKQVVVGELREDMTLCGRPALLSARVLDAQTLSFKPALFQRLTTRERAQASRVVATRAASPGPGALLLTAELASSAVGNPRAASDGDLETTWAEGRGKGGTGEFITFRTPADVELGAFELVVRPPSGGSSTGAGPKQFWLVSDHELISVELPEDPWATPGARYRVDLATPWKTRCVAFVAGDAYGTSATPDVTIAELVGVPSGGALDVPALIAELEKPEPEARRAVALLAARGKGNAPELVRAFASASPTTRARLLDVFDQLPCSDAADAYAGAIGGDGEELQKRGARGFERCPREAGEALSKALGAKSDGRGVAAREARLAEALALFAPARAVTELTPRLAQPNAVRRKNLRIALAQATRSPAAADALRSALTNPALPPRATVDLLRALGERAAGFPEASSALSRLLAGSPTLDTRYLLLRPAAHLSADPGARKFLETALTKDESPLVRSAAAEIAGEVTAAAAAGGFVRPLTAALGDPNVRVRSAAARSLGALRAPSASEPLRELLEDDDWPLARVSAAEALGELPADLKVDGALAEALEDDDSPSVRARSARALGSRGATAYTELLREVLGDDEAAPEVRREAATALGALCDADAVSVLTSEAKRLADPMLETGARSVASASARALGRIRPNDLAERLAPLLGKKSPPPARAVAQSVLDEASSGARGCRKSR